MRKLSSLVFFVGLLSAACNTQKPAGEVGEMAYDTLTWCDSVVYPNGAAEYIRYACECPRQNGSALADSIQRWVLAQFGDTSYEPSKDMAKALTAICAKVLTKDSIGYCEYELPCSPHPVTFERDFDITVVYDSEQYTTLTSNVYTYSGGAHGSTLLNYATFRKSDGHMMGWDLLDGMSRKELTERIKQGLCGYFDVSMGELPSCLLFNTIDEDESLRIFREDFPLPATPPYLTADGVSIIYQQYEIACYAAGMPTCVVK